MKRTVLALGLWLLTPLLPASEPYPGYTWQPLGNGVFVHTRTDPLAGPIDGNSVVIVNDRDVFVVDTHINPAAARAVIAQIRELTDRPVTHVINTHWHDDHTNGNHAYRQAFPGATFVAHRATAASLQTEWQKTEDERRSTYASVRGRDVLGAATEAERTDRQRAIGLRMFAGYRDALAPELDSLELVYPDLVFDDRVEFRRGNRSIVVQWIGNGNTRGDAVVWLPDDKMVITGDILVSPIPFAFDAPMIDWARTLDKVEALGATVIVPGHGAVQRDSRYLRQVGELLETTVNAVRDARTAGAGLDDLAATVDLLALERAFTVGDATRTYAWRSFYLEPALKSAWAALGYPIP